MTLRELLETTLGLGELIIDIRNAKSTLVDSVHKGQLALMDLLTKDAPEEDVPIHGALNMHAYPIKEYDVRLSYGDLLLIVNRYIFFRCIFGKQIHKS